MDLLTVNRYLFLFIHHLISRGWEVIINAMSINDNQRYCLFGDGPLENLWEGGAGEVQKKFAQGKIK